MRSRACCRRPGRRSSRSAALDTAIGQQFAEVAAGLASRVLGRPRRRGLLARADGLPLGRGRPRARNAAARPAGVHRRADRRNGRQRRPHARHRRRRSRCAAREPARRAPARRASRPRLRLAQPRRNRERHRRGARTASRSRSTSAPRTPCSTPSSARPAAAGRPSTATGSGAARGHGRRRAARALPRRAVLRARRRRSRPARSCSTSTTCASASASREIAQDDLLATLTALSAETVAADLRRLGVDRGRRGRRRHAQPDADARARAAAPGRRRSGRSTSYGVAEAAKEALVFALIGFLTVHGLPGRRSHRAPAPHARPCSAPSSLERAPWRSRRIRLPPTQPDRAHAAPRPRDARRA